MGSWRQQQRLHMTLSDAHFPYGPLLALPNRSTSPRAVWNTSTFASSCLNRCTILKTERGHRREGWVQVLEKPWLTSLPPLQNCAELLCRSLSGAKRSSPHLWPKSVATAIRVWSCQKTALFARSQRSVTEQIVCRHPCLGTSVFHPSKKAGLQVVWYCFYYKYIN